MIRIFIFFMFLGAVNAYSQVNRPVIRATVVQGQELQGVQLFSLVPNIPIIKPFTQNMSGEGFNAIVGQPGSLRLRYTAPTDFVGVDKAVFECSESLFGPKSYVTVEINVVRSLLQALNDYATLPIGMSEIAIDVTANDVSSTGNFTIVNVENAWGGSVSLLEDGKVLFKSSIGFSGLASFNYIIKDDQGTSAAGVGQINVLKDNVALVDTLHFTHVSSEDLLINLPSEGFSLTEELELVMGTLTNISPFSIKYSPAAYSEGTEFFVIENPQGLKRYIEIELIKNEQIQNIVVDDVAYTSKGQYVIIDALANDYKSNTVVIDYSPGLIYTSGIFTYIPEPGFVGVKQFYYTVHDGLRSYTGAIDIYIGDYLPQITDYQFITRKNTPLVLEYNIPIKNYSFTVLDEPSNGQLMVNKSEVNSECSSSAIGYQMVSYSPTSDFIGTDAFKIRYCVNNGSCRTVNVEVKVDDSIEDCNCIGPDCVWAGDSDRDGVVNVADLLPIGYHYGESGTARASENIAWGAEYAEDWDSNQVNGLTNAKFVDANGDGIVSSIDTAAIIANYNNFDNLVSTSVLIDKKIPLRFAVSNSTPQLGDAVKVDIFVGSDEFPVVDLHGLALSLKVPTFFMDSTSKLKFIPNTSWFGQNSPMITLSHTPSKGKIEIGLTRTVDVGISGSGPIGSVSITGGIDIDGLRPEGDEIPVDIVIPNSFFIDGSGRQYSVDGATLRLMYQLGNKQSSNSIIDNQIDVLAYPNPSSGELSFHANNSDELQSLSIFNMVGKLIYTQSDIKSNDLNVNLPLTDGFYLAHVTTTNGKIVKKIEIIK